MHVSPKWSTLYVPNYIIIYVLYINSSCVKRKRHTRYSCTFHRIMYTLRDSSAFPVQQVLIWFTNGNWWILKKTKYLWDALAAPCLEFVLKYPLCFFCFLWSAYTQTKSVFSAKMSPVSMNIVSVQNFDAQMSILVFSSPSAALFLQLSQ